MNHSSHPTMPSSTTSIPSFCLLSFVLFRLTANVVGEPRVPCFFIFGDSLVDNGNNNHLQTTAKVNYSPYGVDFPAGPTGRFTNGRNIVDVIAQMLGFDDFIPPFANFTTQDVLRGINYGSGGAGILDESGYHLGNVISLNEQLRNHDIAISRLVKLLGSRREARKLLESCLYYVGMGNNDYLGNYLPKFYASAAIPTDEQFAAILIKQYLNQLRRLYYKGARKVAVLAVGKLGCVPQQMAAYGSSSACVETSNDIVSVFNEDLKLLVDYLNDRLPNAQFVYTADVSDDNAASYGNITILSDPCCPLSAENLGSCEEGGAPCSNRDEYYFWDGFHPTEAAVLLSAKMIYDAMSALFTRVIDVS